jgi:hypothetical protein
MATNITKYALLCAALLGAFGCATSNSAGAANTTTHTTTTTTATTVAPASERGAGSAREVIEGFLAAVRADNADAAASLLTERLHSGRSDSEAWGLFWTTWRSSACELGSLDGVRDGEARGASVSVEASVHLRCAGRERESTIRLERTGDRWLWNEN